MDLWYTRCPLPTASGIAIERGMLDAAFSPQGISIRSLNASPDRTVREAHYDHGQRGMFRQGGSMPPIWSRSRGAETVVLATSWVKEYQALIALPESGIQGPAGLRGRRFGLPRRLNDPFDYWRAMCLCGLEKALRIAGLAMDDIEIVDLPVTERQIAEGGASRTGTLWRGQARARRQSREMLALIRGEVDIVYTASAPGAQLTAFAGAEVVVNIGEHPDAALQANNQLPIILTVDRGLLRDRPDVIVRYLQTLMDAAAWATKHAEQALAIIAEDVSATREWVLEANGANVHQTLQPALAAPHLEALESMKDFLLRHGYIDRDFSIADWVDSDPIKQALLERGAHATGI